MEKKNQASIAVSEIIYSAKPVLRQIPNEFCVAKIIIRKIPIILHKQHNRWLDVDSNAVAEYWFEVVFCLCWALPWSYSFIKEVCYSFIFCWMAVRVESEWRKRQMCDRFFWQIHFNCDWNSKYSRIMRSQVLSIQLLLQHLCKTFGWGFVTTLEISRKFASKNNASVKLTQEDNKANGNGIILCNETNWDFKVLSENLHTIASNITWFGDGKRCSIRLLLFWLFCMHRELLTLSPQPNQLKPIEMIPVLLFSRYTRKTVTSMIANRDESNSCVHEIVHIIWFNWCLHGFNQDINLDIFEILLKFSSFGLRTTKLNQRTWK